MTTKYYATLTSAGAAKLANAAALGTQVKITKMGVGDGNGVLPVPDPARTALVHEVRRSVLNSLSIDPDNANQIIAEQVIPESEGGWFIREIGLYDDTDTLIAVANCPETYKPLLAEGSGRTQTIRMIIIVSSTESVTLKIDPSVVLATRLYVDNAVVVVRQYADSLMSDHNVAADPHQQYSPKANPTFTGTPKAPTAAAGNNSTQLANTAFVQAALAALAGTAPEALDTLKELADALGNDPDFSATVIDALSKKMDISKNGADIADVAEFLLNLGLGTAAKRDIGTGASQIPDMSSFTKSTQAGVFSAKMIASNFRLMEGNGSLTFTNGQATFTLPLAFPSAGFSIVFTDVGGAVFSFAASPINGSQVAVFCKSADGVLANSSVSYKYIAAGAL